MQGMNKTLFLSISSDGMMIFSPVTSARYRRSSVSINPSCPPQVSVSVRCDAFTALRHPGLHPALDLSFSPSPQLVPLSPFSATADRLELKRQVRTLGALTFTVTFPLSVWARFCLSEVKGQLGCGTVTDNQG